jgi:chromatin assembly factor 1 subunit A
VRLTNSVLLFRSTLPLSELTATCLSQLEALFPNAAFTSESVSSKIKIVATRDSYIVHPEVAAGQPQSSQAVNVFEDTSGNRMWRWEVTSLDLLPEALVTKVKKARTARRKLRSHFKALCKLIGSLRDADKLIRESSTPQSKLNALSAKISNEEEKVLKYEREEEKLRLADEAKKKKSALIKQKELEKQLKQKAKDEAQEQKRQQQEQKKKEAQAKKLAKEEKAAKEQREKERALKQQRSALMKFIHVGESTTPPRKKSEGGTSDEPVPHKSPCVDSDKFWSKVNSGDREGTSSGPFSSLSVQAKASRKRRSRHVPVLVYVTVEPEENVFNAQDYAEQQTVHVSNRFRFLSFFEDCRPPYHGTWSKKSSVVTGAKPFGKDTDVLDYEVDSEAEWEEGDDDMGEDVESKGDDDEDVDEDARDTRAYDFQDGWMAADDDLGDDEDGDLDDETKMLRKKKMQTSGASDHKQAITEQVAVSIVAPMPGGVPFHSSDSEKVGLDCIEGIEEKQATDMLTLRRGQILEHEPLWLDAFPPALIDEDAPATQKSGSSPNSQEMSRDDLKVFVDFVHHCTYPSKDRVVEELRTTHKNITSSRAQATRKLDAVANKRRNPAGGVIWEVNRDILEDLGMDELLVSIAIICDLTC